MIRNNYHPPATDYYYHKHKCTPSLHLLHCLEGDMRRKLKTKRVLMKAAEECCSVCAPCLQENKLKVRGKAAQQVADAPVLCLRSLPLPVLAENLF